jgi:hypothetical protein
MSDAAPRDQTDTETVPFRLGLRVPFSAPTKSLFVGAKSRARRTLVAAVAVKLTLDLLFVCALALYTQAVSFRADFDGALEYADGRAARGWVADNARPGAAVEVQLYVDGRFAAAGVADRPTDETHASGGRRGFDLSFAQLPPGEHEARVYAVRAGRGGARITLRQVGGPLRFVLK